MTTQQQLAALAEQLGLSAETVIEAWAERAAIREFDGQQARADAEAAAVDDVRVALSQRKGPKSAASAPVGDLLADVHRK